MTCAVCHRETQTLTIGGQVYCRVCGTVMVGKTSPSKAGRPVMDVMSKRPSDNPQPKRASDIHSRVKSAHVVDLRDQKPIAIPDEPPETPSVRVAHSTPAEPPRAATRERHLSQFTDRFERAKGISRSAAISKFGQDRMGNIQDPEKMYDRFGNPTLDTLTANEFSQGTPGESHDSGHSPEMPHMAVAQHQAMTRLAPTAPAPPMATMSRLPSFKPSFSVSAGAGRVLATGAAVFLMAGYIWTQNYPKMALQNADSRAGITASLPGFVPSSYNLAKTSTSPGHVTLNYSSPSASQALSIAQSRTTWDTNSLLDEFVAQNADDYAAIQGEGLTIFLYNDNDATWVNHGVWYTIAGAAQLSRDQILKIAYSL